MGSLKVSIQKIFDTELTVIEERIANDVLSLSRIQLHVLAIYPVEFTLVSEVERIISIFRNEVKMSVSYLCPRDV